MVAETQFRRALAIGQGDPLTLVSTPLSAVLIAISFAILIVPYLLRKMNARTHETPDL